LHTVAPKLIIIDSLMVDSSCEPVRRNTLARVGTLLSSSRCCFLLGIFLGAPSFVFDFLAGS
jgi:hypothetical protein